MEKCYGKYREHKKTCNSSNCRNLAACWRKTALDQADIYTFSEKLNPNAKFWLPRDWVRSGEYAELISAARRLFPAIAIHWNLKSKVAFPGERTLAIITGMDLQTVRKGLRDLENQSPFGFKTLAGKRNNVYEMFLPYTRPSKKNGEKAGENFPFHSWLILSGIYRGLKPAEQSMLMGLKAYSRFDLNLYDDLELGSSLDLDEHERMKYFYDEKGFKSRKYDFFRFRWIWPGGSKSAFAEKVGIGSNAIAGGLRGLEARGIIEHMVSDQYKVFLRAEGDRKVHRTRLLVEIYGMADKKGWIH